MVRKGVALSKQIRDREPLEVAMAELAAQGMPAKEIAETVGVHIRIVYNRLQNPAWLAFVREIQENLVVKPAEVSLRSAIPDIIALFLNVVRDENAPLHQRLQAADWVWQRTGVRFDLKGVGEEGEYYMAVVGPDGVARVLLPGGRTRAVTPTKPAEEEPVEGEFKEVEGVHPPEGGEVDDGPSGADPPDQSVEGGR